jgi:hypothetical protein
MLTYAHVCSRMLQGDEYAELQEKARAFKERRAAGSSMPHTLAA